MCYTCCILSKVFNNLINSFSGATYVSSVAKCCQLQLTLTLLDLNEFSHVKFI